MNSYETILIDKDEDGLIGTVVAVEGSAKAAAPARATMCARTATFERRTAPAGAT